MYNKRKSLTTWLEITLDGLTVRKKLSSIKIIHLYQRLILFLLYKYNFHYGIIIDR